MTGKATIAEAAPAKDAESAAGRLIVVGEAVTAKDMHFLGGLQVAANVEGIIVKDAGAISCEVGDNARTRRSGHSAKDSNGLRRELTGRDNVASILGARLWVENSVRVLAQIAIQPC